MTFAVPDQATLRCLYVGLYIEEMNYLSETLIYFSAYFASAINSLVLVYQDQDFNFCCQEDIYRLKSYAFPVNLLQIYQPFLQLLDNYP